MSSTSKLIFKGMSYASLQVGVSKVVSFMSQIILAWVLLPEDFGKITLVYTITFVGELVQNMGLTDALISKGKHFKLLQGTGKSLSAISALIGFLLTIILGVVGSFAYSDSEITTLVLIYSISLPFNALSIVADAQLKINLDFKRITFVQMGYACSFQVLTILFALLSFGVYSFVFASVLVSIGRFLYMNYATKIQITKGLSLKYWKSLVPNGLWGFIHAINEMLVLQSDYVILGLFATKTNVGIYFMAYSLSVQVIALLANNIAPVVFPVLTKIKEHRAELSSILLKITSMLALIGMPFAMLQAVVAEPLVKIVLSSKWYDSIYLVQILSLGMGFRVVGVLYAVPYKVNSLYKEQACVSLVSTAFLILMLLPLCYFYDIVGAAVGLSAYYVISTPILLFLSYRKFDIKFYQILMIFVKYVCLSVVAFVPIYLLSERIDNLIFKLLLNLIVPLSIYYLLLRLFAKKELNFISGKIRNLRGTYLSKKNND